MRIYKGIEIDCNLSGWYSALIPAIGYVKADTTEDVKQLIRDNINK